MINYRCIKRIMPTNKLLYLYRIKDSNECNNCNQIETIGHMLWHCPRVQIFWRQIKCMFENQRISYKTVLTGFDHRNNTVCRRINTILSLGKQFIWYNRDVPNGLTKDKFILHVFKYIRVERYALKVSDREQTFNNIWANLFHDLKEYVESNSRRISEN